MVNKSRQWAQLFIALVLALLWVTPHALAQTDPVKIELVGVIDAVNGTTLTINDLTIDASTAEVSALLEVGQIVKVEGQVQADGSILASEVKTAETTPNELEIVGSLESLSVTTATVSGLIFDITNAEIEAGLAVGDIVTVHASLSSTNAWTAREIGRPNTSTTQNDDVKIVGTLEQLGDGFVVVNGLSINTLNAEMHDPLVVGSLVVVEGTRVDGEFVAREVKPTTEVNSTCQFQIESSSANLRSGPGTGYDIVGYAYEHDQLAVLEVHTSGEWIKVAGDVWLAVSVGELDDHCTSLPSSDTPFVGDDGQNHDAGDDHGQDSMDDSSHDDGQNHDSNDDHGSDDGQNHDSGDDHGSDDSSNHDSGDDNSGH